MSERLSSFRHVCIIAMRLLSLMHSGVPKYFTKSQCHAVQDSKKIHIVQIYGFMNENLQRYRLFFVILQRKTFNLAFINVITKYYYV